VAKLAELAQVSSATVSMIERGKRAAVNITTVDRILAAMDLRLHIETVPLWADLDEAIDEVSRLPLSERVVAWPFDFGPMVSRLDGIPYLLDGLTAAALQGAPVLCEELEIALPRDDEVVERCVYLLEDMLARRGEGFEDLDPRERGSDYYTCLAGRIRVRLIDQYRPLLWVDVDPLHDTDGFRFSMHGREMPPPLVKAHLPVVPLTEIQAGDSQARRIIERVLERRRASSQR
jgi:transcriptional regulator with XRE-family HTH domain